MITPSQIQPESLLSSLLQSPHTLFGAVWRRCSHVKLASTMLPLESLNTTLNKASSSRSYANQPNISYLFPFTSRSASDTYRPTKPHFLSDETLRPPSQPPYPASSPLDNVPVRSEVPTF
ncbi:hypothetical protein KFK09_019480 [Dendrobium nobile]|uniref:Uncharacterized protein n=1 Tax=Dendrobium nobile TaxID=94219 RepID=A0A8T3AR30_DENNO|nr:hypothetical protein KFK09_019480 [Dendrobium nobile]